MFYLAAVPDTPFDLTQNVRTTDGLIVSLRSANSNAPRLSAVRKASGVHAFSVCRAMQRRKERSRN